MKRAWTFLVCAGTVVALGACSGTILPGGGQDAGDDASDDVRDGAIDVAIGPDCGCTRDGGRDTPDADGGDAECSPPPKDGGAPDVLPPKDAKADALNTCYDENMAQAYVWTGDAQVNQNKCSTQQIADHFAACLGPAATRATCDAFENVFANRDCERCIVGAGKGDTAADIRTLPPPPIVPIELEGVSYLMLNSGACAAGVLGLPACGAPAANMIACQYGACTGCSEDELDACLPEAEAGACSALVAAHDASCYAPIAAGKATWEPQCLGGAVQFEQSYFALATKTCGP